MIKLPAALEKKLSVLFPKVRERERFVADLVSKAISNALVPEVQQPLAIGGMLHLFTDGGSRGNPGQAAIGCVLFDPATNTVLREHAECIGIQTNNIAEYQALIAGLKMAREFHPNHLVCHLDSELVVKQLSGEYRVKMATFQPIIEEIAELKAEFPLVEFKHVPRDQNGRADALVNRALDANPMPGTTHH